MEHKKTGGKPQDIKNKSKFNISEEKDTGICPYAKKCGGCDYQGMPYEEQLSKKQKQVKKLLGGFCKPLPILGMDEPLYYRNKVHHVIAGDRKGNLLSGCYEAKSHKVVDIEGCMLEDRKCQAIIKTIKDMMKSFKIQAYDEDRGRGLLRHVLVRRGFATGEIMVVLVATSPIFPSKNNFVKALREKHKEITTVILNINDRQTSMVLGERNICLYGSGFIRDTLLGKTFRISPDSFYQVNPVQTARLYETAIAFAGLRKTDVVIDAYCGIGTIGLAASGFAGKVIGVELNENAVKDARINCKENHVDNAWFYQGDAGEFMSRMASEGQRADVVFMDPPRTGSTKQFLDAVAALSPKRVVYISCNPQTQADDLAYICGKGYRVEKLQPVEMFCFTKHVECVALMMRVKG